MVQAGSRYTAKLDLVPINDTYKDLVVRKLSIDFRDILVSYLLDSYIANQKYEAAFFLLQQSDPYFKHFHTPVLP
ncbi:MAG: hypothetical protein V9E84_09545 [Trichococcus flocculiformis]